MSKKEDEAFEAAWNTPPAFGSGFPRIALWILAGLLAWVLFGPSISSLMQSNTFNNQSSNGSHSYYYHSHHHSHKG
jgi:hypothetical protein